MSAETKQRLDEAIAAHIADEVERDGMRGNGHLVTGYALIVSHANLDDFDAEVSRYIVEYADRQPFHVGLGLVHRHRLIIEHDSEAESE